MVTETTGTLLIEEADEFGNVLSPSSAQLSETLDSLTVSYTYDLFNRLISTKTGKKTVGFTYEADGYRHSKNTVTPSSKENIVYFYEGDHVAFEADETGKVTAVNHYGTSHYARTIYESEKETTFYYQFNAYGDVTALIGTDGNTIAKYEYDAFGNLTSQPDTKVNNSITYRGYEYDAETGLYYLNARYYDSETARFLTEDTYRGEKNDPLSLNLYTYCKNNPLKYTDPTGHSGMVIAKIVATLTEIVLEVGFTAFTIEKILEIKKDISQTLTAINSNKEKSVKNEKKSSEVKKKDAESEKHSQNSSESNNQNQSGNKRGNNNSANNPPKDSSHSEKYEIIERNTKTSLTVKYNGSDTSLYRGGNSFEVRPADIRIDPNTGLVQPTHGLSVNVDPNAVVQFGGAYRIDELPKGLTVIQRGNRPGHFEIVPEYPMPIDIYQYLLRQIKVSKKF